MSAADSYLFGPRPWGRFVEVVRKGLENYRSQQRTRSAGRALGANPITAVEGIAAHLLAERFLRKWLKAVPLRTLDRVFETPSGLPALPAHAPPPERQAQIERILQESRASRVTLSRWDPDRSREALEQRRLEEESEALLQGRVGVEFGGFRGAEMPGCPAARKSLRRIARLSGTGSTVLGNALRDLLRDYQIRHNRHVLSRQSRGTGAAPGTPCGLPEQAAGRDPGIGTV